MCSAPIEMVSKSAPPPPGQRLDGNELYLQAKFKIDQSNALKKCYDDHKLAVHDNILNREPWQTRWTVRFEFPDTMRHNESRLWIATRLCHNLSKRGFRCRFDFRHEPAGRYNSTLEGFVVDHPYLTIAQTKRIPLPFDEAKDEASEDWDKDLNVYAIAQKAKSIAMKMIEKAEKDLRTSCIAYLNYERIFSNSVLYDQVCNHFKKRGFTIHVGAYSEIFITRF